jgi:hypothetical protein
MVSVVTSVQVKYLLDHGVYLHSRVSGSFFKTKAGKSTERWDLREVAMFCLWIHVQNRIVLVFAGRCFVKGRSLFCQRQVPFTHYSVSLDCADIELKMEFCKKECQYIFRVVC